MPKVSETVLEIDLNALEHNYNYFRKKLDANTKFMGVVKAFAYGSDSVRIAQKLAALGIDYVAVAYANEGVVLRKAGVKIPILVLHPQPINFKVIIEHDLEPSLYSQKILQEFMATLKALKLDFYPVHLKFNTGLNRLGFTASDVANIKKALDHSDAIKIKGVFSHLAASDDLNEADFTKKQIASFQQISTELDDALGYNTNKHLLNTSGILNYLNAQYDMVRSGIGLYGFGNNPKIDLELKPVATLKTVISQIHKIEPKESVGYNRAFTSNESKIIATLPIGHADGIGRQYGNGKASVIVNGSKATIVGNVCMDMIMIDISNIACKEGDQVIIFGSNHNAEEFASQAKTISYELLTGISQRVKRAFIGV